MTEIVFSPHAVDRLRSFAEADKAGTKAAMVQLSRLEADAADATGPKLHLLENDPRGDLYAADMGDFRALLVRLNDGTSDDRRAQARLPETRLYVLTMFKRDRNPDPFADIQEMVRALAS